MVAITKGIYAGATADLVAGMLAEFQADVAEQADSLSAQIKRGEGLDDLRRFVFEVQGQAHNFNHLLLETTARQAQNYLTAVNELDRRTIEDLITYIDIIASLASGETAPDADAKALVRRLPARPAPMGEMTVGDAPQLEVVAVMELGAQTHFVEREMRACGYRITIISDTLQAMARAVLAKPDVMIISAVMPGLSGIDLAIGLKAMPETRNIPVAVLTSLPKDHPQLKMLPETVPIIRKGDNFGDDLAKALHENFLL
jgi:CheY-like chemotaxis protein